MIIGRTLFSFATLLCSLKVLGQTDRHEAIYYLKYNDTLKIELSHVGCNGGLRYKYDFFKTKEAVVGICYKPENTGPQRVYWRIDTIVQLNDVQIETIADFEDSLLNYKPSPRTNGITGGGSFKVSSNRGYSKEKEINGFDSFAFGANVRKIFGRKT